MLICEARSAHLDQILEIERLCFSLPWTRQQLEHQISDDKSIFLVALGENGDILGYVGMKFVLDEGYISNIAVAPNYRRRGVADALLDRLEELCILLSLSFITLEVRQSNAPAAALYEKHGYHTVGIRRGYYERPREDALLMTRFLTKPD